MSTGRKSQLEKFESRMRKAQAIEHTIAESNAKAAMEKKDIIAKGKDVMKQVGGNPEDVFMVIARDSMETFIKTWNNSMENVLKETIRTEVQAMVQSTVQSQLETAVKGVFAGFNQAMENMIPQMMSQQPVDNTPVEFDLSSVISMDELIKRKQLEEKTTTGPLSQRVKAMEELTKQSEETVSSMVAVYDEAESALQEYIAEEEKKKPRYAKARIMSCGLCGEKGHNRRGCTNK